MPIKEQIDYHSAAMVVVTVVVTRSASILVILSGKNMMRFRTASRAAIFCTAFCAMATFACLHGQPAFAEDGLSAQCLKFSCAENYLKCTGGGHMSGTTVDANPAIPGCPSRVTVTYDGNKTSTTPFHYYSCGCRRPDISKVTK